MSAKGPISAESAEVTLRQVSLPFGLVVDSVHLTGSGLRLEVSPWSFSTAEPANFTAVVTDLALQAFLDKKSPGGLRDFFVQLSEGQVHVHATAKMIIEIRAVAICSLEIVEAKQIFVRLEKVDVLGVGARGLVQKQLDEINPIVDVRELPVDIQLLSAVVEQGTVTLKGTVAKL